MVVDEESWVVSWWGDDRFSNADTHMLRRNPEVNFSGTNNMSCRSTFVIICRVRLEAE
jgi:hypothetical protein